MAYHVLTLACVNSGHIQISRVARVQKILGKPQELEGNDAGSDQRKFGVRMRIAVVTRRSASEGTAAHVAYGTWTEAEDVLIDSADTDLVVIDRPIETRSIQVRRRVGQTLRRVAGEKAALPRSPGDSPLQALGGRYDLAVFMAYSIWDLPLLEEMGQLRKFADNIAVWFLEAWPSSFLGGRVANEPFHTVDHIFVGMDAAVEPLAEVLGREVTYLPIATDTIRFSPQSASSSRPIDLIGLGRRRDEHHREMLKWSLDHDRFYLFDTGTVSRPRDLTAHRDALGRWYSQSKLATCNYAKNDEVHISGDLRVMPGRLWEGLAAGAALVGLAPNEISQREIFGRTVVHQFPEDDRELPAFLEDTRQGHAAEDVTANVRLALEGHDWAHRWKAMLDHLGLETPTALQIRIDDLADRASKFL